jgi:hypothetical protein
MFSSQEIHDFINANATGATIAGVGGFVHYIYKVSKWEQFSFTKLVINIILAGWIGYLCQQLELSSFYISIAWFCTYPLLNLIETKGVKIISEIFLNKQ